ncbi:DUF6314 family protein [Amycolatopsis sp. H20-H5]|uniref:DUF6314 family protein n=1 Tax=Amycolatopsis sp. H20-H5 TaxID=3046309 RepID=UPI003FA3ABC5
MELFPVPDLVAYLTGNWRLEREILDASGATTGTVAGSATFVMEDSVLVYREAGTLEMGGYQGPVTRELHYRPDGPGRASVHFDHGGFFHDVDLREGRWDSTHPCRDDVYRGGYRVLAADRWRQEWAVTGPAKDHVLLTWFSRRPG